LKKGDGWQGGTLKGLKSKLGYLRRLGVTAIWISPVFKQVAFRPTYHGYGIQDFLEIDPHFGTREDLRNPVDAAHQQGIYCILDIILNHSGDVFGYKDARYFSCDANGNPQPRRRPRRRHSWLSHDPKARTEMRVQLTNRSDDVHTQSSLLPAQVIATQYARIG
jgi:glycosidase